MKKKLKKISKKSAYLLNIAIVGMVVGLSIQFVRAWAPPTTSAPGNDVNAPVLTNGNQDVNAKNVTVSELIVTGGIKLGGVRKNAWPQTYEPGSKSDFTVGTSTAWTVPYGVNRVHIEAWGGGGGGAAGRFDSAPAYFVNAMTGSAGGSGGYVRADLTGLKSGDTLIIGVGKGGAGGLHSNSTSPYTNFPGGTGGTSFVSFNGTYVVTANGGLGGYDANDYDNRSDMLYCSTRGGYAAGGVASSTIPGANLVNGKNASYCVTNQSKWMIGDYWSPVSLTAPGMASPGGVTGLDTGAIYGQGGAGVGWGSINDGVGTPSTATGQKGSDGKVVITY